MSWADGLAQGTDYNQRIGKSIRVKSFTYNLNFFYNYAGLGTTTYCIFRFMILYPRKGLSTSDVRNYLNASTPGLNGAIDPNICIALKDSYFAVGSQQTGVAGGLPVVIKKKGKVRLRSSILHYTSSSLVDKEPFIYIVTSIPINDSSSNYVAGYTRMSFKDL